MGGLELQVRTHGPQGWWETPGEDQPTVHPLAPALTFDLFTADTAACDKGEVSRSEDVPNTYL